VPFGKGLDGEAAQPMSASRRMEKRKDFFIHNPRVETTQTMFCQESSSVQFASSMYGE
jgi:hypothetical protein